MKKSVHELFDLTGQVALVTGGSRGLGLQIAESLGDAGARIMLSSRKAADLEQAVAHLQARGIDASWIAADAADEDQARGVVTQTMQRFGQIDILVNNVGRSEPGDPVTMDEEVWDEQMNVNLKSAFLCCKEVLPIMERQGGGSVVNVASIAGLRYIGKPQVAYSAAKAALMQLTATTAVVYAQRGVRLNCVVPGLVFTPLVRRLADKYAKGDFEGYVAHRHQQVPMGRMGDAWDVANAALFLASDESKYITAQQLVVDGGITAATR